MSSLEPLEMENAEHTIPPTKTLSSYSPAPCFVENIFVALRECVGSEGELTSGSLTLFGICAVSDSSSGSVLLELANHTSTSLQRSGLEVLHPTGGTCSTLASGLFECFVLLFLNDLGNEHGSFFLNPVLVEAEDDREPLMLTLHLPASPLLELSPVLLLGLDGPFTGGDLGVTFTSQSLQPNTQVETHS